MPPPLRSREPRSVATSGKRRWIALGVNSLKHVNFLKIEVTGRGAKFRYRITGMPVNFHYRRERAGNEPMTPVTHRYH